MVSSGIAFVVSHLSLDDRTPVEIFPGHTFRQATPDEIAEIKKQLTIATRGLAAPWAAYEGVVHEERHEGSTTFHVKPLLESEWKYWVIAFEGNNADLHELELMANLLPVEFDVGFILFYEGPKQSGKQMGMSLIPLHIVEKYTSFDLSYKNAQKVTPEQLKSIGMTLQSFRQIPESFVFIKIATRNFFELRRIPATSDLIVVGLFAIIESLITHAPRLSETLDSINHQITNKIILLRKEYEQQILPSTYFQQCSEESIWKKLYSYRSAVAHGTPPDFSGSHQVLVSRECVIRFLRDNIKQLILLSIKKPEFISDLRKC